MSSTEEYLDSLLRSVMSGKKPPQPIDFPTEEKEQAATAPSESVPVVEEPTPAAEPVATVVEEPVPVAEPVAPVMEEPAPAPIEETIPVETEKTVISEDITTADVPVMPAETPAPREHVSFIGSIMSEIPSEDISAEPESTPVSAPEEAPVELAAEARYILPDEPVQEMPVAEAMPEMPVMDEMPVMPEMDMTADMPAMDMPVMDEMPMQEEMPVMDEMPMQEEMPIMDDMPAMDMPVMDDMPAMDMPVMDEMPAMPEMDMTTEMPVMDDMPVMPEMDMAADMPVMDEMPAMDMPVADEMSAMPEMDEMPMPDEMPVMPEMDMTADMPVPEEMPTQEEMPVMEEMPMPDEMPVADETTEMPATEGEVELTPDMMPEMFMVDFPGAENGEEPAEQLPDEDISNLLKSIEEMDSPLDESPSESTEEVPATDEMSMSEEMPGDELPAMEETPETAETPAEDLVDLMADDGESQASEEPASDDLATSMDDLLGLTDVDSALEEAAAGAEVSEASDDVMGLDELLSGMEDDSELTEIGDLLSADDNNEAVDASILESDDTISEADMLNIDEALDEDALDEEGEGGKKKKKKKKKKEKKQKEATEEGGEKKEGFFSRFLSSLTQEVDAEETQPEGEAPAIFEETAVETAAEMAAENEKIMNEMGDEEEEGEAKGKKGKKAKKEKKPKEKKPKVKKDIFPDDPSYYRKLPRTGVIMICILCFSLGIVITLVTFLLPYYRDTKKAQSAYDHGNYIEAYTDLKGHSLNKKQQEIYNKSVVILKEKRKLDSYDKYMQLNMPAQALDALLQGLKNAKDFGAYAEELGVKDQFDSYTREIEARVSGTFGLDLETAYEWAEIDDAKEYSRKIYQFLTPGAGGSGNAMPMQSDLTENPVIAGEEEEFAQ